MSAHKAHLPIYYLKAGELFIMDKPAMISTLLGSCIAVTLFNPRLHVAGICHALLPRCKKKVYRNTIDDLLDGECQKCTDAFKYADCAVSMMIESFWRFGVKPEETEARLFGGAKMMSGGQTLDKSLAVGDQNVNVARKVLANCRLKLKSTETGGTAGRKILFNTNTGEITCQLISRTLFKDDSIRSIRGVGHNRKGAVITCEFKEK